ncbi:MULTISPECIES: hypothetical protein [unclassified Achromobacter]|uniref:hypothetical protein n=1 Tax=unclassified Achromobacter TaxID=2626865 RepID=UPI000B51E019|nr:MULTISPECIES: hypothetical protein [unclassified Achromobacter]OWT80942.1 hypothetical protein CEY05_06145 [Achromobacter sp. HZ34]OWT81458.1 hypothetical protein CEY04_06135 [Achromobacter sp. HZ28]
MALDGEPKDGDYVRYVERMVHRGMPAPGQVGRLGSASAGDAAAPGRVQRKTRSGKGEETRTVAGTGASSTTGYATGNSTGNTMGSTTGAGTRAADRGQRKYPAGSPAWDAAPDDGQAQAMQAGSGGGQPPSLAARSAQRKVSSVVFVVALLIGWHAVRMILGAVESGYVDGPALLPGVFLLVFAFMVLAMSRNIRRSAERPGGKLPPLTTVSNKKPGQGG